MKFFLLLFLQPIFLFAQDTIKVAQLPLDSDKVITYKIIENVPDASKDELYDRAKIWATLAFKSAKTVIQLDDKTGGTLIIKAVDEQHNSVKTLGMTTYLTYYLHFTLHFTVKAGKYRLIMTDFAKEFLPSQYSAGGTYPISGNTIVTDYNNNVKSGNNEFNKKEGPGKKAVMLLAEQINNLSLFAEGTIADVKAKMLRSAKGDDF